MVLSWGGRGTILPSTDVETVTIDHSCKTCRSS